MTGEAQQGGDEGDQERPGRGSGRPAAAVSRLSRSSQRPAKATSTPIGTLTRNTIARRCRSR